MAEAFHTFSEANARELAERLGVSFEACCEELERLAHRLN